MLETSKADADQALEESARSIEFDKDTDETGVSSETRSV